MKRTPLKRKTALKAKRGVPKRRKKSDLKKLKEQLWKLCREISINRYGSTCYSCGKKDLTGSSRQLGHFIPSSVCSVEMRYSLDNLRIQCYHCNINLSGNWPAYEQHLIQDHGINYVANLKIRNERTKGKQYDSLWYKAKITEYEKLYDQERT